MSRIQDELNLSPLKFTKMTGAGNDFIFVDGRENPSVPDRAALARNICRRALSLGADGLVFLEKASVKNADFKWDFYNADGSRPAFCGNAARCVARLAYKKKISGKQVRFETDAGVVQAQILDDGQVQVEMPTPEIINESIEIPVGEHLKTTVFYVKTGVPHVVKETDDWEEEYLIDMGSFLRNNVEFEKTEGANATFYEVKEGNSIQSATFERGVEAVTMACGTGAVAAALAAVRQHQLTNPVTVHVPGGVLVVHFEKDLTKVSLTGDARFICEGEIYPEALTESGERA